MRNPNLVIEALAFDHAAQDFAETRSTSSIATMMELATEARTLPLRRWAARWLSQNLGIVFTTDQDKAPGNATPTEAANIR